MKALAVSADRLKMNGAEVPELAPRVLAGVAAILQRHTDRGDFMLGYAGPEHPVPIPIPLGLGDDPTFAELLTRVRAGIVADRAVAGEHAPVADFDAVVGVDRDPPKSNGYPMWLTARAGLDAAH